MKAFLRVTIVSLLFAATFLMTVEFSRSSLSLMAQVPNSSFSQAVLMSLPDAATVTLSGGTQRQGKVIAIDAQKQSMSLRRGKDSTSIALSNVQKVTFDRASQFYRASGPPVIRGEQANPTGPKATWNAIEIKRFRITDASRGQAEVDLDNSSLSRAQIRGVLTVARNSTYVADEMRFDLSRGTMTIVVTPY